MGIGTEITRLKGAKADLKSSINAKSGALTTELIDEYAAAVDGINIGTDTSDATATESDILLGKTAYVDGAKITGTSTLNADTTDATLTANDMLYGVTGYGADGTKLTGAGAYWQYVKQLYATFPAADLPSNVVIYAPNATIMRDVFTSATGVQTATITFGTVTTARAIAYNCTSITSIALNGSTASTTDVSFMFSGASALASILGTPLNFSSVASFISQPFQGCGALVAVSIEPSTIKASISLGGSSLLSTASLLSIANGLDAGSAPKTLTMHATSKTNMDNITVDNVDGVAVLGMTKTLTQFITTDKGWTIA